MPASRGTTVFDAALYTSSTLALNVDNGSLAWHFQHAPAESLDLDEVTSASRRFRSSEIRFPPGRRADLDSRPTTQVRRFQGGVYQNIFESFYPTPGATVRSASSSRKSINCIAPCPSTELEETGSRATPSHRRAHIRLPIGMEMSDGSSSQGATADQRRSAFYDMPGIQRQRGTLAAFDVSTMKKFELPASCGILTRQVTAAVSCSRARLDRVPCVQRQDRRDSVGDTARHLGPGLPGDVQRRWQAVCCGRHRSGRRQPAQRAGHNHAGDQVSGERPRVIRVRVA